jgi:hypothetical protein
MGNTGEKPQEDTVYYEKVSFELNILVCGNYVEGIIAKDLNQINELIRSIYKKGGKHNLIPEWEYFFLKKIKI